jgi:regulator of replication initiation timing
MQQINILYENLKDITHRCNKETNDNLNLKIELEKLKFAFSYPLILKNKQSIKDNNDYPTMLQPWELID